MNVPERADCHTPYPTRRDWLAGGLDDARMCRAFVSKKEQEILQKKACVGCGRNPWRDND